MAFLLAVAAASLQPPALALEIPAGEALTQVIAARDAELFELLFQRCEPERMRALIAADMEFYHDKDGRIGTDAFMTGYRANCAAWAEPNAWRSRRELVAGSLVVDPVPGIGAIEAGEHVFYERQGTGPERLAGRARFAQLWVLTPTGWRLSRVLSYAHAAAAATEASPRR
jgi:hypothetical protein